VLRRELCRALELDGVPSRVQSTLVDLTILPRHRMRILGFIGLLSAWRGTFQLT
jgi:hypothetical protein